MPGRLKLSPRKIQKLENTPKDKNRMHSGNRAKKKKTHKIRSRTCSLVCAFLYLVYVRQKCISEWIPRMIWTARRLAINRADLWCPLNSYFHKKKVRHPQLSHLSAHSKWTPNRRELALIISSVWSVVGALKLPHILRQQNWKAEKGGFFVNAEKNNCRWINKDKQSNYNISLPLNPNQVSFKLLPPGTNFVWKQKGRWVVSNIGWNIKLMFLTKVVAVPRPKL